MNCLHWLEQPTQPPWLTKQACHASAEPYASPRPPGRQKHSMGDILKGHQRGVEPTTRTPNLFALIIGIDGYPNCKQLHGAVADAKDMNQYLEEFLGVPSDNIQILLNSQATRCKIIDAFEDLQKDPRIHEGDPIVIFFAGYGAELPIPADWNVEGNKIQCLVPYDYGAKSIHPIPDYMIGALINKIATNKRNNITVIFDCCHLAGGAGVENDGHVSRTIDLDTDILKEFVTDILNKFITDILEQLITDILKELDKSTWVGQAGTTPAIGCLINRGLQSHILLAACGETELAYENNERGLFTRALLQKLRKHDGESLTYAEVIDGLQISGRQNPQCIGVHQHREIFSMGVPTGARVRYPVRVDEGGRCIIGAGCAHGVSDGVEFTLYGVSQGRRSKLGVIEINSSQTAEVDDFNTSITSGMQVGDATFAMLTRVGKVPLYLPVLETHKTLRDIVDGDPSAWIVEQAEMAKLEIVMEDEQVVFRVLDRRVKGFGLERLPHTVTLGGVANVLNAAAHYYWYLDLANSKRLRDDKGVTVDLHLLKDKYDDFGLPYMEVVPGPGLRQQGSADRLDVIELVVAPNAYYGIKITNNTRRDFYVNVFLFNNGSLSIAPCYTQPNVGNPEPPLKANGTFCIGYGPGGTAPLNFFLATGQDVDVAYLAVFFATRPIDLTDIGQASPFSDDMNRPSSAHIAEHEDRSSTIKIESIHTWFTVVIPVVQKAGTTASSIVGHTRPA